MKKVLYTLLCVTLLFACEDNFNEFYLGGIPSRSQFDIYMTDFNYDFSGSDYRYHYGIENNYNYGYARSTNVNLPHTSTTFTGNIQTSVNWKFTNIPDWITISPASGTPEIESSDGWGENYKSVPVTFTISGQNYVTPRFATVYLEGTKDNWKRVDTLHFIQYGVSPDFAGLEEEITMKAKADTVCTYFNSNCEFEIECSSDYGEDSNIADWFNAEIVASDSTQYTHKIVITSGNYTKRNNSSYYDYYTGYLKFYNTIQESGKKEYIDYSIRVVKQAPNIDLTPDIKDDYGKSITYELSPASQKSSILVNANYDFEILSDSDWISVSSAPIKEDGFTHRIDVEVTNFSDFDSWNSYRNGYIKFYDPNDESAEREVFGSINIKQYAPSVSQYYMTSYGDWSDRRQSSYTFGPEASTITDYFTANCDFTIKHDEWLTVSVEPITHEKHTHKINISVKDYPTSNSNWYSRNGTIQFLYNEAYNIRNMEITQNAPSASFEDYPLNFKGFATKDTINVTANCGFTTACSADWLFVDKIIRNDSTYNAQIVLGIKEFPTETSSSSSRDGEISLYYDTEGSNIIKKLDYLTIYQNCHTITTTQSQYSITSNAQTLSFEIEADAQWTASSDASWISLNATSGEMGKHTITLNIEEMPAETYSRYSTIEFNLFGKTKLSIEITQVRTN